MRTTIDLGERHHEHLSRLAARSGRTVEDVVRDAVEQYLVRSGTNGASSPGVGRVIEPAQMTPEQEAEWQHRFDEIMTRIWSQVPADVDPEEIERDITIASEEARQERIATGRRTSEPIEMRSDDPADWKREFQELLARVHSRVPADMTSEDIEREITLASEEVRLDRLSRERDQRA